MSYHNSYDRGGGFNNYNNRGNFRNNFNNNGPRINENQVPQSKHTIFIRGLAGDISTDDIKEYIGDKVGKISFDFVKVSQDKSKMFVAVRFEKRDEAKEFMDLYSDREFMGCRCELSWFRDIRRYCAYQRAKQVRSNSQRRRRRSDSEDSNASSRRSASPERRRSRSASSRDRSRSRSRSKSRSPSRSPPRRERQSRGRKRSVSRSRSRSYSKSRSRSRSPRRSRTVSSRRSEEDEMERKNRLKEQELRMKRRRELSEEARREREEGDDEEDEEEAPIPEPVNKKKIKEEEQQLPQIPLPPKAPAPMPSSPAPPTPKHNMYIPPPTVPIDMELESPPRHVPTNPYYNQPATFQHYQQDLSFNQHAPKEQSPATVSYSVPMEEEAPPKMIYREAQPAIPLIQTQVTQQSTTTTTTVVQEPQQPQQQASYQPPLPPPVTQQPAFVPRQIGKIEIVMPSSLPAPPVVAPVTPVLQASASTSSTMNGNGASNSLDATLYPHTNKHFGHLRAFQSALLSTVKYEPPVKKEEEEDFSSLRLSSLATEEDSEEQKAQEREEKLARLSDEQLMRFLMKKKNIETAYRKDCETYAVVTRALLSKDESLQFGLKMSLLENMEDLYKAMMQRLDDQLNLLLAMP